MNKQAFEQLIRKFAETRGLPSAEAALDPAHVDRLHEKWLSIARERNFNLSDTPVALFELQLAWALKFGGPIVQDRWERAKPYSLS